MGDVEGADVEGGLGGDHENGVSLEGGHSNRDGWEAGVSISSTSSFDSVFEESSRFLGGVFGGEGSSEKEMKESIADVRGMESRGLLGEKSFSSELLSYPESQSASKSESESSSA